MSFSAFEPLTKFTDHIGELSKNIGTSEIELRKQYISKILDDVNNSSELGIYEKGIVAESVIKHSKSLKKKNVSDIMEMADDILKSKNINLLHGIENIHTNWMLEFLDNCKNTTDLEMKEIWAKILSGECEKPGSVSKRLLGILRIIDKETAENFGKICLHTIVFHLSESKHSIQFVVPYIRALKYDDIIDNFITNLGLSDVDLKELETIGLINFNDCGFSYEQNSIIADYYGSKIMIRSTESQNYVDVGQYQYTKYGKELANIIYKDMECNKDQNYIEFLVDFLSSERHNIVTIM